MRKNFQEILLSEVQSFALPLIATSRAETGQKLLVELTGWELASGSEISELITFYKQIDQLNSQPPKTLRDVSEALYAVNKIFSSIQRLRGQAQTEDPASEKPNANLIEALLTNYLKYWHPAIYHGLTLLTVIRPPDQIIQGRISQLLSKPLQTVQEEYFKPESFADGQDRNEMARKLFKRVAALLEVLGFRTQVMTSDDDGEANNTQLLTVFLQPNYEQDARYGVAVRLLLKEQEEFELTVTQVGELMPQRELYADLTSIGDGISVGSSGLTTLGSGDGHVDVNLSITHRPGITIGSPVDTRFETEQIEISGSTVLSADDQEYGFLLDMGPSTLVLSGADSDGFLRNVFPKNGLRVDFDFAIGWANTTGFYFPGGLGLEAKYPLDKSIQNLTIHSIALSMAVDHDIEIAAEISISAKLGPISTSIAGTGVKATLMFSDEGGNRVPNLSIGFKPPTAIGLSIDSQGIKGGGFLSLESPNYFGVLELSFQDEIDLTAFGLITTELPDGKDGFSLVISILAEFQPIQLGLGFALTGVGGLIGINRHMNEDALRESVKNHSLDHILFPAAPIKDAVKIIDSIKKILPPKEGFHVFGPMAQIIWGGSVTLVEFQVGIFIEIGGPVRIALIGQASSRLPNKKAPVVVLNMDLLGYIDFGKETVAIDSSLFDSHIQGIKIDGQMALRSSWGDDADFAMSVGGFFPRYTPPPGFPTLKRLAITLGDGNPKISLSAYMAITSNTLQFGALLELWAKKRGFTLSGGMGFDALFIFNPFSFEVAIEAWVDVRRGGFVLMAVSMALTLTGPNPFRAKGYAKIRICWFLKFKVRFDVTFGKKQQQIQATVSPLAVLRSELEDPRNIHFELPHWASATLMFAESADQRLDRSGSWVLSQNAVPLNFPMARFGGTAPPAGEQQLSIAAAVPGDTDPIPSEATTARFAPEQFHDWSVEDRLAAPAFEEFESGIRLGGSFKSGPASAHRRISVEFETILRESDDYLSSLNEENPKKVPQRYLGLASSTIRARSQATARSRSTYTPRRTARDTQHPNFVSVAGAGR